MKVVFGKEVVCTREIHGRGFRKWLLTVSKSDPSSCAHLRGSSSAPQEYVQICPLLSMGEAKALAATALTAQGWEGVGKEIHDNSTDNMPGAV